MIDEAEPVPAFVIRWFLDGQNKRMVVMRLRSELFGAGLGFLPEEPFLPPRAKF